MSKSVIKVAEDQQKEAMEILQQYGISTENIIISSSKKADRLEYTDDGKAICRYSKEEFDLNDFDQEMQEKSKKLGIHPKYINILEEADKIKKLIKGIRLSHKNTGEISPGKQIRHFIQDAFNQNLITDEIIDKLTDKSFSTQKMSLAYPMLKEVTNLSDEEIKTIRKDNKGHYRYSPTTYTYDNRQFMLTNDLYERNLEKVKNTFIELNILPEENMAEQTTNIESEENVFAD